MQPKKIALVLAFPLVVALGWGLRAALQPAGAPGEPADPAGESTAQVEPSATEDDESGRTERPARARDGKQAAGKQSGDRQAGDRQGGGKQAGRKNDTERGGREDRGEGTAKKGQIETVRLTLVMTDGADGPPASDLRVFLSASAEGPRADGLRRWAQSKTADDLQRAAFGDLGLEPDEDGTVVLDVPTDLGLRIDLIGDGVEGGHRATMLRALKRSMTSPREIDMQKTQLVEDGLPGREVADAGPTAGGSKPAREGDRRDAPVTSAENTPKEFFYVKLLSAADGEPVEAASVRFGKEEVARSDEDGRFSLAFDPSLSPVLQVEVPGFAPAIVQAKLGHHYPERAELVELRAGGSLQARILSADGVAARGTRVVLSTDMASVLGGELPKSEDGGEVSLGEISWSATANQLGMVFFESLPTDARLEIGLIPAGQGDDGAIRGLGAIPEHVTLAPGEAWAPEWRLPGRPEIAGRLVDQNGDAIADASIWLVALGHGEPAVARYLRPDERPAERATTDAQGRFSFLDLDPVPWLVGLAPERPSSAGDWQSALGSLAVPALVDEGNAAPAAELLLIASRGLTIRGVVLGPSGYPAAGALVTALEEHGHGALEVRARENGAFVIGPLSAGRFALLVSGCDDCGVERFGPFEAGSREIVLGLRAVRRYSGHVVSSSGSPRAAQLSVFEDGSLRARIETRSGLQPGRFELALDPGLYDLVATTNDGEVGALRAVAVGPDTPNTGFTLPVERGALVSSLYRGDHPWRHVSFFHNGRLFSSGVLQAGVRHGQFVPAGRILVRVQTELGEPPMEREFEISTGSEIEVDFGGPELETPTPVEVPPQQPVDEPLEPPEPDDGFAAQPPLDSAGDDESTPVD